MGFGIGVSGAGMGPRGALDQFAQGEDNRGQVFNRRVVVRLLAYLRPYPRQMAGAFLAMLARKGIRTPVILTTGMSTMENAVRALSSGAIDFIPKPFTVDELLSSVYRARRYHQIKEKQKQSEQELENLFQSLMQRAFKGELVS